MLVRTRACLDSYQPLNGRTNRFVARLAFLFVIHTHHFHAHFDAYNQHLLYMCVHC